MSCRQLFDYQLTCRSYGAGTFVTRGNYNHAGPTDLSEASIRQVQEGISLEQTLG
jgi:hypothetical protein